LLFIYLESVSLKYYNSAYYIENTLTPMILSTNIAPINVCPSALPKSRSKYYK